jgi:5-methylcytosine-specific restriction endonuclease McrA
MPTRPATFRASGRPTPLQAERQYNLQRGSAHARGYDARWARASKRHRQSSPLCRYCETGAFGRACTTAATLVDHLYPHNGDQTLFWTEVWWVSACKDCHDGPKQAAEHRGQAALDALAIRLDLPIMGRGVQISTAREL